MSFRSGYLSLSTLKHTHTILNKPNRYYLYINIHITIVMKEQAEYGGICEKLQRGEGG